MTGDDIGKAGKIAIETTLTLREGRISPLSASEKENFREG
jgi:hypothetical protein